MISFIFRTAGEKRNVWPIINLQPLLLRDLDQLLAFGRRPGHGLFDEHMFARQQSALAIRNEIAPVWRSPSRPIRCPPANRRTVSWSQIRIKPVHVLQPLFAQVAKNL